MLYKTSVPVRFDSETKARLEAISASTGLNVSDLVRFATMEYLKKTEEQGQIMIPLALREEPILYGKKTPAKAGKSHKPT